MESFTGILPLSPFYLHFPFRDIKPANILLMESADGLDIRLADFGVSKILQASFLTGTMIGFVFVHIVSIVCVYCHFII